MTRHKKKGRQNKEKSIPTTKNDPVSNIDIVRLELSSNSESTKESFSHGRKTMKKGEC